MTSEPPIVQENERGDLTVYTGRVIGARDNNGDAIVNCSDCPRLIVLSGSRKFSNLHGNVSLLVRKHGRTHDFSSLYLPEEEFKKFLDQHGIPQLSLIETAMIKSQIKQETHFSGNPRALFFYDTSDRLQGAFPFAIALKPDSDALMGGLTTVLGKATGVRPKLNCSYKTDNGYYGVSGVSSRNFRDTLDWAFRGFDIASVGIENLSVGSHESTKRVSCLTLRDCVEEFSKYRR